MRFDLVYFDLTRGLPIAWRVLRHHLGWWTTVRALVAFTRRSASSDPFAGLGPAASPAEAFTRHQLAPVLHLDVVLRENLHSTADLHNSILEDLVGETGAAFIAHTFQQPSADLWRTMSDRERRAFARGVLAKFENASGETVEVGDDHFGVDITFCHFAALTSRLGRPDLGPLFCRADSVFFGRPGSAIRLDRDETIAAGGRRCAFRFRLDAAASH